MIAHGANLGSLLSYDYVTAVGALPNGVLLTREHDCSFHLAEKLTVTLLMSLLNGSYLLEKVSDLSKALLAGGLG